MLVLSIKNWFWPLRGCKISLAVSHAMMKFPHHHRLVKQCFDTFDVELDIFSSPCKRKTRDCRLLQHRHFHNLDAAVLSLGIS